MDLGLRRRVPEVAAAVAATLIVAACGAATGTSSGSAAPGGTATVSAGLAFRGTTVRGSAFDASSLRGQPVVLWFWAPWCTICRGEAPTVTTVAAQFAGRVRVVGVAGQGTVAQMRGFISDTRTGSFTHVADTTGAVWREYQVVSQPSFVFVRPDGQSQLVVGALDAATLTALMESTAAGSSPAATHSAGSLACSSDGPPASSAGSLACNSAGPSPTATPTGPPSTTAPTATHYSDMLPLPSS